MTLSIAAVAAPSALNIQAPVQAEASAEVTSAKQGREDYNAVASPYNIDATAFAMSAVYDCRKSDEADPTFDRLAMIEAGFEHMKRMFAPAQDVEQAAVASLDMAM